MAIANIPLWNFEPNWLSEVRETLVWMTDILATPSGAEQRRSLRKYPRRMLEYSANLYGDERTRFDHFMMTHGGFTFYMPIWPETHVLTATAVGGTSSVPVPTVVGSEVHPGDVIYLLSREGQGALHQVAAINAAGISIEGVLTRSWPQDTLLFPVKRVQLTEQPSVRRISDMAASAQVRLQCLDNANEVADTSFGSFVSAEYRGFRVLSRAPDERDSLDYQYERLFDDFDVSAAKPFRVDTAKLAFPKQRYNWTLIGRGEMLAFKKMVYGLRGRALPFWLPTFYADFRMVADTPVGESAITVSDSGFHLAGGAREGRRDIVIELVDGTRLFRRITASAQTVNNREIIGLDIPPPGGLQASKVMRISFMALARLDQDTVEIAHKTDNEGLAQVSTTFRSAPDLRHVTSGF